mmetsp:Transcript_15428/g.16687  ORF Transcript_15428/g.16687 Transcript_15428/m.16687 type:complete len:206 (+) Transcript_15428:75-692(+)
MSGNQNDGSDDGDYKNVWHFGEIKGSGHMQNNGMEYMNLENFSKYRCLLCGDVEWTIGGNSSNHRMSKNHTMRVRELKLKQTSRIEQFKKLDGGKFQYDLQRFGFVPESIKMLLDEWLIMKDKPEIISGEIERVCSWYQQQEPLVQLELVLWKNACLHNFEILPTGGIDPFNYFLLGGWKENKAASRRDRMISIVITNVLPFLDM